MQTEYWDEKKNSKRKDGVLAELQAQTLNLNTELRAMRRESATAAPTAAAPVTPQPLAYDPSPFLLPSLLTRMVMWGAGVTGRDGDSGRGGAGERGAGGW